MLALVETNRQSGGPRTGQRRNGERASATVVEHRASGVGVNVIKTSCGPSRGASQARFHGASARIFPFRFAAG